ncbi:hypothetical protein ACJZ2D_001935 [Fusarium nematophilum]
MSYPLLASCAGVDNPVLDSFCLCLPSFPNSRPRESEPAPRQLPAYSGPDLHAQPFGVSAGASLPRVLPLKPEGYAAQPPPYYPSRNNSLEVKPLRLVRASRKRRPPKQQQQPPLPPPSYYESYSHTLLQSVTTLTFESSAPPPPYSEKMASQPIMPKVGTATLPSGPGAMGSSPGGSPARSADDVLADLRRQLDDSASEASSIDSQGRRRRRRNNKQLATRDGIKTGPVLPRLAETKPVRLQLGLNLDVEVELKARLQGDVSLTLLACELTRMAPGNRVEKKKSTRESTELKPNMAGEVFVEELFFLRLGTMRFRQKWLDGEVSPSLTASLMLVIGVAGFAIGFLSCKLMDSRRLLDSEFGCSLNS